MTTAYAYGPGTYNTTQLQDEVVAAGGGPAGLLYISSDATIGSFAANISIFYTSALSGADKTALDALVTAHSAVAPPPAGLSVGEIFQAATTISGSVNIGIPIGLNTTGNVFAAADAGTSSTRTQLIGCLLGSGTIVGSALEPIQISGLVTLSTAQWDSQTSGSGGLTPGTYYYTRTGGGMQTTPNSSGAGVAPALVGLAISATQLLLMINPPNVAMPTAWVKGTVTAGSAAVTRSMGVTSVSRLSAGKVQVTWARAFPSADYFVSCIPGSGGTGFFTCEDDSNAQTTTTASFQFFNGAGTLSDPNKFWIFAYGG